MPDVAESLDRQTSRRLVVAARQARATHDSMWRAAAWDFLEACFTGAPHETTRELADVFMRINQGHQA